MKYQLLPDGRWRKPTLLLALLVLLPFFPIRAAQPYAPLKSNEPCQLTFGWTEWKPFQYLNAQGKIDGLQIELLRAVTNEIGCNLSFVKGSWAQLLSQIKLGQVDIIANATETEERLEHALFSKPYRTDTFAIYVRSNERDKYEFGSIKQLKRSKFRLALTHGYLYGEEIESWKNDPIYKPFISYANLNQENFRRLLNGEIDGFIEDPMVVSYLIRSNELKNRVSALSFSMLGLESSYMFSKKSVPSLTVERFNQALTKIKKLPKYQSVWLENN